MECLALPFILQKDLMANPITSMPTGGFSSGNFLVQENLQFHFSTPQKLL
jgi:hypothetical protein